jgi:hypothetical protein
MTFCYTRPAGTNATSVGNHNRGRWTRHLRERLNALVPTIELIAAEAGVTVTVRKTLWEERPKWTSTRIRTDHLAVINLLQARHLNNTGKEISRAEVLAALMAAGLEPVINVPQFSASSTHRKMKCQSSQCSKNAS